MFCNCSYKVLTRRSKADEGTRTPDPHITNVLLYQLSYIGMYGKIISAPLSELLKCTFKTSHPGFNL